jgi:MFS superfamily sulfate permease-like transporter
MVFEVRRKSGTNTFRPRSSEHPQDEMPPGLLVARVVGRIYFANVQNVGQRLRDLVEAERPKVLILDCSAIPDMEYTALMALMEWEAGGRKQGTRLVLAALTPPALEAVQRTSLGATLGRSGMFATVEIAVDQLGSQQGVG